MQIPTQFTEAMAWLDALETYDAPRDYHYWPPDKVIPPGFKWYGDVDAIPSGNCAYGSMILAAKFGGSVCGYMIEDDDPEHLVAHTAGGHDFAVVKDEAGNEWILDWWAHSYENRTPIVLAAEAEAHGYKPRALWEPGPELDREGVAA